MPETQSPCLDEWREIDGIFFDRLQLERAVSVLHKAGFAYSRMTATLEKADGGGRRVAVTEFPPAGFTQADERQLRTLGTSVAGAVAGLGAAGVAIATGGTAVAAVAAAALAGSGIHVIKTLAGYDGVVPDEDVILSVRVNGSDEEKRVVEIFGREGAEQIWAQERQY